MNVIKIQKSGAIKPRLAGFKLIYGLAKLVYRKPFFRLFRFRPTQLRNEPNDGLVARAIDKEFQSVAESKNDNMYQF